jgi:flagellin-specific chaperone FliS
VNNKIKSWDDYWKIFDLLIDKLKQDDQRQIINELKDAQKLVNGLTDGWYDFKTAMEKTLESNKIKMTTVLIDIANELIQTLNYSLTHRG